MDEVEDEVRAITEDIDTNPLTRYDAERERVAAAVSSYAVRDDDTDVLVPTECLAEDLEVEYELPVGFTPGKIPKLVAANPWGIVLATLLAAGLTMTWVALTPGERFSTSEDLFIARGDPDVANYYVLRHLPRYALKSERDRWSRDNSPNGRRLNEDPARPLGSHAAAGSGPALAPRPVPVAARRSLSGPSAPPLYDRTEVTIVFERRGGDNGPEALSLRQLKEIRDLEHEIYEWADEKRVCWTATTAEDAPCLPFDGLISYMYPTVTQGANGSLVFDGRRLLGSNRRPASAGVEPEPRVSWGRTGGR